MTSPICKEDDCGRRSRALGLCRAHYQARRRRLYGRNEYVPKRFPAPRKRQVCQHLDCRRRARYRFTLPYPITRQENACYDHGNVLLGSFLPGVTIEDI